VNNINTLLNIVFSFAQPGYHHVYISALATQPIDFGPFVVTGPGTIQLIYNGNRSATGGVIIIPGSIPKPAIFDIKLCQGRNVTITYDPTTILTYLGNNLTLNIGPTEHGLSGSTFPVTGDCNFITTIRVGGTLEVPGGSVVGVYTGSFSMTFKQE
ncbi:MAG: DUF4402 domain-containing protein, partial [Draconibacterium sp.]|nr:DUF4402 domain-containing protein [Draconibacterium sp.]